VLKGGERVRVPDPSGQGTVEGVFVAPSEPTRKHAELVWVRYLEGAEDGRLSRVRYDDVERDPSGKVERIPIGTRLRVRVRQLIGVRPLAHHDTHAAGV
jgi:hypothetical protein